MTIQLLKKLIEIEFERTSTNSEFKSEVLRLIELYGEENSSYNSFNICNCSEPDELPYSAICGCNPKNGGSGVCGCTLGNLMVKNPKKYGCGSWVNSIKI